MKFTFTLAAAVGLSWFLTVPGACVASPVSFSPLQPIFASGKPKLVKFWLQSNLSIPIDLKVGENPTTLQPGQRIDVRLPVGTQIIVANTVTGHPSGEVIVDVQSSLADATVHIKA